ncbi:MAG TPA: hypothetical protein VKU86_09385 [Acidimicrobiales bacterium]|nr:hypothetical protein [Acidimicrobiales bacterium]
MNPWSMARLAADHRAGLRGDLRGAAHRRALADRSPAAATALAEADLFRAVARYHATAVSPGRGGSRLTRSVGVLLVRAGTRLLGPAHLG